MSSSLPLAATAPTTDAGAPLVTVLFSVQARAEPAVLPRVVELFAKRGLVPQRLHSTTNGPSLAIDVQIAVQRNLGDYIARCMRQIVGVETILTSEPRLSI